LLMRLTGGRLPVQCGPEHPLAATGLAAQPVLADRGEAERAFALAERLGSVNAATHLGTIWLSLRKAFTRHGLGMPARNPEAVRQRAIATASRRAGRPPRPWARCLLRSILAPSPPTVSGRAVPVGPPRGAVRHLGRQRGGRAVQRESRPPAHHRAWAIIRRADRSHRLAGQRANRPDRRHADRADRTSRSHQPQERAMVADAR
jgi:hypothetical protein